MSILGVIQRIRTLQHTNAQMGKLLQQLPAVYETHTARIHNCNCLLFSEEPSNDGGVRCYKIRAAWQPSPLPPATRS